MEIRTLLFIGRRNAARSIMAETCFNSVRMPGWRAFSAGWETELTVDRRALRALEAAGYETDSLYSKPLAIFRQAGAPPVHCCIFMDRQLPAYVDGYPAPREYWRIADPSTAAFRGAQDSPQDRSRRNISERVYQQVLEAISLRVTDLIVSGRLRGFGEGLAQAV